MKYEFIEINNFIVAHASAEHFEADFKLYRKLFPESRILKTLENPFPPQKKELDERMLYEILNADRICMETILEYRGIIVTAPAEESKPEEVQIMPSETQPFIDILLTSDIENIKYNDAKTLAFGLKLNVFDQKATTLKRALSDLKAKLMPVVKVDANIGQVSEHADNTEEKKS